MHNNKRGPADLTVNEHVSSRGSMSGANVFWILTFIHLDGKAKYKAGMPFSPILCIGMREYNMACLSGLFYV